MFQREPCQIGTSGAWSLDTLRSRRSAGLATTRSCRPSRRVRRPATDVQRRNGPCGDSSGTGCRRGREPPASRGARSGFPFLWPGADFEGDSTGEPLDSLDHWVTEVFMVLDHMFATEWPGNLAGKLDRETGYNVIGLSRFLPGS